jgi:parallel beta-helix repeat protein
MSKSVALLLVLVFLMATNVIAVQPIKAESTIIVPDDYPTIAAAIGNATAGDIVFVKEGTYDTLNETLQINKSIKLIGENRDTTIIDGNHFGNVVEVTANNVEISGFTIQNSGWITAHGQYETGIYVKTSTGSKISDNTIKNNFGGLAIDNCMNIFISENKIQSNFGSPNIFISYSSSVTFSKNDVTNNTGETIVVYHSSNIIVSENQIVANGFGNDGSGSGGIPPIGLCHSAIVSNSHGVIITMNNITDNAMGLGLIESHGNDVFRNDVRRNGIGISFSTGATDNRIYENNVQANDNGMVIYDGINNHENRIYSNNFTSNTVQIYFYSPLAVNIWDNGAAGNYWSDYAGIDENGDGIGDSPYVINANNTDRYPLMFPSGTFPLPTPTPTPTPTATPIPTPVPTTSPTPEPTATPEIPEFPSSTILVPVIIATLLALLYFKKRKH